MAAVRLWSSVVVVRLLVGRATAWDPASSAAAQAFADQHVSPGMQVLDVGGRDVNGGARPIFERAGANYTSQDIEADASVDVVSPPGEPLPFADGSFDVVFSSSVFEHDPVFWMTIREMARVTKMNGTLYVAAPSAGPYHAWPGDNYRFYKDAPAALAFWCGKVNEGRSYPIAVMQQRFMAENMTDTFNFNIMVWKRTSTPATQFTVSKAMHAPTTHGGSGGTGARKPAWRPPAARQAALHRTRRAPLLRAGVMNTTANYWERAVVAQNASPPRYGRASIFFVHVEKTGGTSLMDLWFAVAAARKPVCVQRYMRNFSPSNRIYGGSLGGTNASCPGGATGTASDLVFGHVAYMPLRLSQALGRSTQIFSVIVLRDPVARAVSFAKFRGVSLARFPEWARQMQRLAQTRAVAGMGNRGQGRFTATTDPRATTCVSQTGPLTRSRLLESSRATMSTAHAEAEAALMASGASVQSAALASLEPFAVVGVTERFPALVWSLSEVFAWPSHLALDAMAPARGQPIHKVPHAPGWRPNATQYEQQDVSQELQATLYLGEWCDLVLWRAAHQLVAQRMATAPAQLLSSYAAYEAQYAMQYAVQYV